MDQNGNTAVIKAAFWGRVECLLVLLKAGADFSHANCVCIETLGDGGYDVFRKENLTGYISLKFAIW